jgi:hypothetical protein
MIPHVTDGQGGRASLQGASTGSQPPAARTDEARESSSADQRARRPRTAPPPLAPAVIPLVHAPDDPGPEGEAPIEPEPEPATEPPADSWSKIRQLFRSS